MKKINLLLAGVLFTAFVFTTSSCKKDDEETATPATNGSATITGRATAELDATNTDIENAPAGTVIIATFDSQDLVNNPSGDYAQMVVRGEVDGNGNFTINVPANSKIVNVTLRPQDFEYNKVISTTAPTTRRTAYSAGTQPVTVVNGGNEIVSITYGGGSTL